MPHVNKRSSRYDFVPLVHTQQIVSKWMLIPSYDERELIGCGFGSILSCVKADLSDCIIYI